MTSNRYVVLNCPTLMGNRLCYGKITRQCADCTDCVIKQVIEKLREADNSCDGTDCAECSGFYMCHSKCANDILQLFDIKEILSE